LSYFLRLSLLLAIALCVGEARAAAIGMGCSSSGDRELRERRDDLVGLVSTRAACALDLQRRGEFSVVDCCLIGDVFGFDAGISLGVSFTPTAVDLRHLDPDCILAEGVYRVGPRPRGRPAQHHDPHADSTMGRGRFFRAIAPEPTRSRFSPPRSRSRQRDAIGFSGVAPRSRSAEWYSTG
jgi:hypothetical protein